MFPFWTVHHFHATLTQFYEPAKQLALGLAFGILIGLIPKGNLTAASLSILMLTLRVNLGSAMLSIFCVSMLSSFVDPLTHGIGMRFLGNEYCYEQISNLYNYPLVPWSSLNNTVVLGGLCLGLGLFYPSYHLSEAVFTKYYQPVKRIVKRDKKKRKADRNQSASSQTDQTVNTEVPGVPATKAETAQTINTQKEDTQALDFDWKNL